MVGRKNKELGGENTMGMLTDEQIDRLYNRLLGRVHRDKFGADWPTLRLIDSGLYNSLQCVIMEIKRRKS